ncbi:MAG: glutamate--tRNA ligase, partial [Chitinophagaceae bacterium]
KGVTVESSYVSRVIGIIKDRCHLITDFWEQGHFFFLAPREFDLAAVQPKWTQEKEAFFQELSSRWSPLSNWSASELEVTFKELATDRNIKPGELQLPLRVMLVGSKVGPPVFLIAQELGSVATLERIGRALTAFLEKK